MQFNETGQPDPAGNLPPQLPEKGKTGSSILLVSGIVTAVALAVAGWWAWRQWKAVQEIAESAQRISSAIETGLAAQGAVPGASPALLGTRNREGQTYGAGPAPVSGSGLSMISSLAGGLTGLPRMAPEMAQNAEKMMSALSKYSDRPLVKEFLGELNSDPDFRKTLRKGVSTNPLGMISRMKDMGTFTKIMEKYSKRPEFVPLIMEVMSDPDIKPLLQSMGPMIPGGIGMPSAPSRMPGPVFSPLPVMEESAPAYDSQSLAVDPSSIQGESPGAGTRVRKKDVPLPGQ